jgi:glycosyltransferase involved in cell wall biosynthesis
VSATAALTIIGCSMTKISAVIITLNEQSGIAKTLQSLAWCDEIVVVDSGSTDATVKICERFGCRVFYNPFTGYGEQKHFAVGQAKNDWVLSVDADEVVTESLRDEILSCFSHATVSCTGFYTPISLVFLGRLMRFGGQYAQPKLRLFNRRYGNFNLRRVHESVELTGGIRPLKHHILHESYENLADYFHKFNHYTSLASQDLFHKRKPPSRVQIFLRLPLDFIKTYFVRGCCLDGYAGFVWSLFSAFYPVVKYAKLEELYQAEARRTVSRQPMVMPLQTVAGDATEILHLK